MVDILDTKIEEIKKLDKKIVEQISKRTKLTEDTIRNKTIHEIEEMQKITDIKPKKIYFKWEACEKTGLQTHRHKIVPEREYNRRERKLERLLKI